MSEAHKGKPLSPEHRAKISGDRNHNYGKHFSPEHRRKISEAQRGERSTHYGKHLSEEHRRKLSVAQKAYWRRKREGVTE